MIKILLKTQSDLWLTFGLTYDIKIFDIQSFHESGLTLAYSSKFMNYFNLKDFFFFSLLSSHFLSSSLLLSHVERPFHSQLFIPVHTYSSALFPSSYSWLLLLFL